MKSYIALSLAINMFSCLSFAMNNDPANQRTISFDKNIRLVFLGKSGAGKSTMINALYNYASQTKWDSYPKRFPIKTPFQECNIVEYQGRDAENHEGGQLQSVTREPSEYLIKTNQYILSLIDCPGAGDTRGFDVDLENNEKIATFINNIGSFNAICVVLTNTINRENALEEYVISQIKSILPQSAQDRIFLLVSFTTTPSKDVLDFAEKVGLPTENVFAFDNFGLTNEGHFDGIIDTAKDQVFSFDPFSDSDIFGSDLAVDSNEIEEEIIKNSNHVKEAWRSSLNQFLKLLRKAKDLGKYQSSEMGDIVKIKREINDNINEAYRRIEEFESRQADLRVAKGNLKEAIEALNWAQNNMNSSQTELAQALVEKRASEALKTIEEITVRNMVEDNCVNTFCTGCGVICHEDCQLEDFCDNFTDPLVHCRCIDSNGHCNVCEKKCHFTKHRHGHFKWVNQTTKKTINSAVTRKKNARKVFDDLNQKFSDKKNEFEEKNSEKVKLEIIFQEIFDEVEQLEIEKNLLQSSIVDNYVELGNYTMGSINFHVGDYYDVIMRNQTDPEVCEKLNRQKKFYLEQIELYQNMQ